MRNKLILFVLIFMCFCTSAFSQAHSINKAIIDSFINNVYWFHKYLPLECIPDYDILREMLNETINANELNAVNDKTNSDLYVYIPIFNNMISKRLDYEIILKDEKMIVLTDQHPNIKEIQVLNRQYLSFKTNIERHNFPSDASCLDQIDEYYSRLIIKLGYHGNNSGANVAESGIYDVVEGDYFRKIARKVYGNKHELDWIHIFNENINNKKLLPNPANPDLIYPYVKIIIPNLPE